MDGTILSTLEDLSDSCNYILNKYGMPVHSYEEIKYMVGNGIPKLIERAVPDGLKNPMYKQVLNDYIEYYRAHSAIKTRPYEGICDLMEKLRGAGVKIAVNTNKEEKAALLLCEKYFSGLIDFVYGGGPDRRPKPFPDGVKAILQQAGVSTEKCVYVGDSDVDIQTGANAGIDAVGVAWGFRGSKFLAEHGAKVVVEKCSQLYDFLV